MIATNGECPEGTPGRQEPRLNAIEELIERRDAEPIFNEDTGEWSFTYQVAFPEDDPQCTQTREVHYLDTDAAQQRMQMSVDNGWLGVSLFAFSYEDDAIWDRIAEINATLETVPGDGAAPTTAAPDDAHSCADNGSRNHNNDNRLGSVVSVKPIRASERQRTSVQ